MMRVRCIFVETTRPVRIRPLIETIPVNGHFLSVVEMPCQLTTFEKPDVLVFLELRTNV